jgi:hypothetical protein
MHRPNPLLWLWYLWGGQLPQRYREWVLHDVTASTWLVRHLLRAVLRTLLVLAVLLVGLLVVLHVAVWLAVTATVLGCVISAYYALPFAWESGDARLVKYGYPAGYALRQRELLADERQKQWYRRRRTGSAG